MITPASTDGITERVLASATPRNSEQNAATVGRAAVGLLLVLAFFVPRWIFFRHTLLNPDAISYWSVGRSLAHGHGLVWDIKPYFFPDDGRITAPVIGYLSIPYTSLLGAVEYLGANFRQAALFSSLIAFLDAVLIYRLARKMAGRASSTAASALFLINPEVVTASTTLWTEPLALLLILSSFLPAAQWLSGVPARHNPSVDHSQTRGTIRVVPAGIGCGLLLGLAYLTRPGDAVYAAAILFISLLWRRYREAGSVAAGFLTVLAPYWVANAAVNHNPFFTMYAVLSRTLFYGSAMYTGFGRTYPSTAVFLSTHSADVLREVSRNWSLCLQQLGDPCNLGALAPVIEAVTVGSLALTLARPRLLELMPRMRWFPAVCAMALGAFLNLVLSTLVWSSHEEARFMLGTWILSLLTVLVLLDHAGRAAGLAIHPRHPINHAFVRLFASRNPVPILLSLLFVLTAAGLTCRADVRELRRESATTFWNHGETWREVEVQIYGPACRRLKSLSAPGDNVAASDPWMVNYLADRPTVLFPALRPGELRTFVRRYRIRWILADAGRMPGLREGDDFSELVLDDRENRDWRLIRLRRDPLLRPIPLAHSSPRIRLYRVDSNPGTLAASPSGGPEQ